MASTKPFKHMVIVLPGIMGSVLKHKDGKDIWALSGQALLQFLISNGTSLATLKLAQDDHTADDLGDGIYADRLISDIYNIPGLMDGAGYSVLHNEMLKGLEGRLIEATIHNPRADANFYTFPYDWRRDNRASARALQRFVEAQLPRWRESSGAKDARVIFMAHSMGGLVARYYVEKLGGWQYTRRLITFGTPHRGSINALDVLSNGFRISAGGLKGILINTITWKYPQLFEDLTAMVRSFPSVYQLLPSYGMLKVGTKYQHVYDTDGIPNLDRSRAQSAMTDFHQAIIDANTANQKIAGYRNPTQPIVGVNQATNQSAVLENNSISPGLDAPQDLAAELADGDGTVPRISAVPLELSDADNALYLAEHHGWLTNVQSYLNILPAQLNSLASRGGAILGIDVLGAGQQLSLNVEPLYLQGEPVRVGVGISGTQHSADTAQLRIEPMGAAIEHITVPVSFARRRSHEIELPGANGASTLPAGLYRARLRSDANEVNATFEVVDVS